MSASDFKAHFYELIDRAKSELQRPAFPYVGDSSEIALSEALEALLYDQPELPELMEEELDAQRYYQLTMEPYDHDR